MKQHNNKQIHRISEVLIYAGPGYLEEWNHVPLASYSMRYLRCQGGRDLLR